MAVDTRNLVFADINNNANLGKDPMETDRISSFTQFVGKKEEEELRGYIRV